MQAYLTLSRNIEEMELLKEDIKNVVSYYKKVKSVVLEEIENCQQSQMQSAEETRHCCIIF